MTRERLITWQMGRDTAIERLERNGNGTVTSHGDYQRRTTLTCLSQLARDDPDATVREVA